VGVLLRANIGSESSVWKARDRTVRSSLKVSRRSAKIIATKSARSKIRGYSIFSVRRWAICSKANFALFSLTGVVFGLVTMPLCLLIVREVALKTKMPGLLDPG